jgi:hypothetical protein
MRIVLRDGPWRWRRGVIACKDKRGQKHGWHKQGSKAIDARNCHMRCSQRTARNAQKT